MLLGPTGGRTSPLTPGAPSYSHGTVVDISCLRTSGELETVLILQGEKLRLRDINEHTQNTVLLLPPSTCLLPRLSLEFLGLLWDSRKVALSLIGFLHSRMRSTGGGPATPSSPGSLYTWAATKNKDVQTYQQVVQKPSILKWDASLYSTPDLVCFRGGQRGL